MNKDDLPIRFRDYRAVPPGAWPWQNFTPYEMRSRDSGSILFVPAFMQRLQALRDRMGFALTVTSGYRSPAYDGSMGGAGVHPTGRAVDIEIAGERAFLLFAAAFDLGFTGVGSKQSGPWPGRFIHLDDLPIGDESHPRPRHWTYG